MLLKKHLFLFLIFYCGNNLLADQFEPFTKDGKVGLKNTTTNTIVIPASYESLGWSDKSFSTLNGVIGALQNEKWALVNLEGHRITAHLYDYLTPTPGGNFIVSKRKRNSILTYFGLINAKGKTIIDFEYSTIKSANAGLIAVQKIGGRYQTGLLSEKGEETIPLEYQKINPLGNSLLSISGFNNLKAIFSQHGEPLTDFNYEQIEPYTENYYLISQHAHQGLLSKNIELIIPPLYKSLEFSETNVEAKAYDQWDLFENNEYVTTFYQDQIDFLGLDGFVTLAGEKTGLTNIQHEYLTFLPQQTLVDENDFIFITQHTENKRFRIYNSLGKALLRDSFDDIQLFQNTFFARRNQSDGHSWSVYNFEGKKLNLFNYQSFRKRSEDFFEAKRNDKIGLIGNDGEETSPFLYDQLTDFKNERAVAYYNGNYGIINKKGLWIMTPYYDSLSIHQDYIYFEQGSDYGIADLYGNINYRSTEAFEFYGTIISKNEADSTKALYSFEGKRLLDPSYDSVRTLNNNLLLLSRDSLYFLYRPSDGFDIKLDEEITHIGELKNDFIPIEKNEQWGFLNTEGGLTIANRYEDVDQFSEGLFGVKLIGKWGFVNEREEIVIQPNYDSVTQFKNGLSIVRESNLYGIINIHGEAVVSITYDQITRVENYFLIKSNSQIGLADSFGNIIKNPSFDSISPLSNNFFRVERNGLYGVINKSGHDVIPTVYKTIKQSGNKFLASKNGEQRTFELK